MDVVTKKKNATKEGQCCTSGIIDNGHGRKIKKENSI